MAERVLVLAVATSPVVRAGLKHILEQGGALRVEGMEPHFERVQETVRSDRPQIVFVDLESPLDGSPPLVAAIKRALPECRVVVLVGADQPHAVPWAVNQGADALLDRGTDEATLRTAASGQNFVVSRQLRAALSFTAAGRAVTAESQLTSREREILTLVAKGYSDASISRELHISVRTVNHHVAHILRKLNARSRKEAAQLARASGTQAI